MELFPDNEKEFLIMVRKIFEENGFCYISKKFPICGIYNFSYLYLEKLSDRCNFNVPVIKDTKHDNFKITLKGNAVLDFLGKIYNTELDTSLYDKRKYNFYKKICTWSSVYANSFNFIKKRNDAVGPFKSRTSDSGYDLTLLEKIKTNGIVDFYDTGITVEPPYGYYFDLVPRSSISKMGYILANNIGIIDRTYQGNIIVPLIKLDITKPDLELPCRLVQIIPRKIEHLIPMEITEETLTTSERNIGGFGSTGK